MESDVDTPVSWLWVTPTDPSLSTLEGEMNKLEEGVGLLWWEEGLEDEDLSCRVNEVVGTMTGWLDSSSSVISPTIVCSKS